jgi:hypothetical protein
MSQHQAFRRAPVPAQVAAKLETITIPAPTRGLTLSESEAFMQPGGAVILDNWAPTLRGLKLRGGCDRWCVLPETTPVISTFRFASGNNQRIFAGNATKLYDVTASTPTLVKSGQNSGNYVASQMANASDDHMLVANDAGDAILHYDGSTWTTFNSGQITGPIGSTVVAGLNLTYVCKYRNRFFFIEGGSMNAYYLGLNAFQGALALIPLAGAATKGGNLLFCATWSIDAGDGIDDKLVFCTDLGELIVFTGGDPSSSTSWRQEGRYEMSPPMGMNAHIAVGGDLLIATVDGILPTSGAITKDRAELEMAAVTRNIKPMWRDEVNSKRAWSWTMHKWDEYGGIFVTWPGGAPGARYCAVVNSATGAWCRFVGYDATCFVQMRGDMFFGTQGGIIMQADNTGYDDGVPYVATMVGGWEMFSSPSQTITWKQARASFTARNNEPFIPQIAAATDYSLTNLPTPPPAGIDPGGEDVWDQGLWDTALWDAPALARPAVRNTGWVSVGQTGFTHAPVLQITVAQQVRPVVELIAISATFERAGINV